MEQIKVLLECYQVRIMLLVRFLFEDVQSSQLSRCIRDYIQQQVDLKSDHLLKINMFFSGSSIGLVISQKYKNGYLPAYLPYPHLTNLLNLSLDRISIMPNISKCEKLLEACISK